MTTLFNLDGYNSPKIPIHDPYWDEIVLDSSNPQIDGTGQVTLFYDESEEPPDPDDFPSLADYHIAHQQWELRYPQIAADLGKTGFRAINDTPAANNFCGTSLGDCVGEQVSTNTAHQHIAHWIEQYYVQRYGKKYWYYRYSWMEGRKIHPCYIGSIKSPKAIAIAEVVRQAIARQESPSEIKELIRCSKLVTG